MSAQKDVEWDEALRIAFNAASVLPAALTPLSEASGFTLARDIAAETDVPNSDRSAMDGWAVAGEVAPWRVIGDVATGTPSTQQLADGEAVSIGTGGVPPDGTSAVMRTERGVLVGNRLTLKHGAELPEYADIRPQGGEMRTGDRVLTAGTRLNPWSLAVIASCGVDSVEVITKPSIDLIVTGHEVVHQGIPRPGQVRDVFSPALHGLREALGSGRGRLLTESQPDQLARHLKESEADVIVTTGGTARGASDHMRHVLSQVEAELLIDGLTLRPGRPTLLARLSDGRPVVSLPGNPLAAIVGMSVTLQPLALRLQGYTNWTSCVRWLPLGGAPTPSRAPRAVPCVVRDGLAMLRTGYDSSMLRGLFSANGIAIIPSGPVAPGIKVPVIRVPGLSDSSP